jgi:hypothetical protein
MENGCSQFKCPYLCIHSLLVVEIVHELHKHFQMSHICILMDICCLSFPILLVAKKQMDGHIWVEGRWQPVIRQSITCDQSRAYNVEDLQANCTQMKHILLKAFRWYH